MSGLKRCLNWTGLRRLARVLGPVAGIPRQPGPGRGRGAGPAVPTTTVPRPPSREDELLTVLAATEGVVRYRGRLTVVRDDLLPADLRALNLRSAAEALEAADVDYGLVPDGGLVHRIAITPGFRDAALKACAGAFGGRPVYAELLGDGGVLSTVLAESLPAAVAATERPPGAAGTDAGPVGDADGRDGGEGGGAVREDGSAEPGPRVKGIRLHQPVVTSGRTLHLGSDHGCDLEFWDASDSGAGGVASLRETPFGWWVPSLAATGTRRIGDRDYPVLDALARRFPEDIDFPIDAVVTWVDASDPRWRRRREEAVSAATAPDGSPGPSAVDRGEHRYRDRGELRYCLRSIAAHAPWVRQVFLVTDDQVPDWLADEHPGLTVVHHRDLFAEPDTLPVFNSHAIETQLHRIPGLAEHYVYFNDDIFLGRPQRPQNFFLPSGLPKVFHDTRAVPPSSPESAEADDVFTASQRATRRAVEAAVGRTYPRILAHTPYPLSRSLFDHLEERVPGALTATSRSVFRSATDVAPVTLAVHLALAEGHAVEGELAAEYVSTDHAGEIERFGHLVHHRDLDAFCLADDAGTELSPQAQQRAVAAFLEAYFPVPSPYERQPAPDAARRPPAPIG
ncbi:stealth family protein [Streptomyces subrutilus]|uniref:stealth family protein n=1 Tax=Streptomyces subrutilus TaxID=36818 RepID=UPI00123DB423|nr:stealth family protein [Streptomyces subrutilus]